MWSLWEIRLSAEGFNRKRFLPIFATDDGRTFVPTAKRVWDLLLTESVEVTGTATLEESECYFDASMAAARRHGERLFTEMLGEHGAWLKDERERARYAYDARHRTIERIGLPAVRQHRRTRLDAEYQARVGVLESANNSVPDLNAVMILRINSEEAENGSHQGVRAG